MNFAHHLTTTVAAGALLAATMCVVFGDDGTDSATLRALAGAESGIQRQRGVEAVARIDPNWRGAASSIHQMRVADGTTTALGPSGR
jgi:hypothetical protein